jgi:O-antigen/teichoic acid export membrane protein
MDESVESSDPTTPDQPAGGDESGIGQSFSRRSVAGNASMLMASQVITASLGIVIAVLVPRHLGSAPFGQLRLGTSLWAISAAFIAFGTHTVLTKEAARDWEHGRDTVGQSLSLQWVVYVASWLGIAGFVVAAGYDRDTVVIVAIVGISVAFAPLGGSARSVLYGLERMEYVAVADTVAKVLHVAVIVALVAVGGDVRSIAMALTVYMAASALMMVHSTRRFSVRWRPRFKGIAALAGRSRTYLGLTVVMVLYSQVDVITISLLVPDETLGWYATADGLFSFLLFAPTILMTSLFPTMARLHTHEPNALPELLRRYFKLLLLIGLPVGLGVIVVANPVVRLMFGDEFVPAGQVLAVFGVVTIIMYLTILLGQFAVARDRQGFYLGMIGAATVASVGLDILLVPWAGRVFDNGAVGGAAAYLVTETTMLVIAIWRLAPGLLDRTVVTRIAKASVAGAAMVAIAWPLRWTFIGVPVLVGAAVYAMMVLLLRVLEDHELEVLRGVVQRAASKARPHTRGGRHDGEQ